MRQRRFVEVFFLVRGSGDFPVDMLRYDACCPATEADSYMLERRDLRAILMRRFSPDGRPGNEARWKSFGWEAFGWSPDTERLRTHPDLVSQRKAGT